jgi:hypothetical protein
MDETFSYLLQSARLISINKATEEDYDFITELTLSVEDELILKYNSTITIPKIGLDYNLFIKLCRFLLKHYEEKEEYEKCKTIIDKMNSSEKLINSISHSTI